MACSRSWRSSWRRPAGGLVSARRLPDCSSSPCRSWLSSPGRCWTCVVFRDCGAPLPSRSCVPEPRTAQAAEPTAPAPPQLPARHVHVAEVMQHSGFLVGVVQLPLQHQRLAIMRHGIGSTPVVVRDTSRTVQSRRQSLAVAEFAVEQLQQERATYEPQTQQHKEVRRGPRPKFWTSRRPAASALWIRAKQPRSVPTLVPKRFTFRAGWTIALVLRTNDLDYLSSRRRANAKPHAQGLSSDRLLVSSPVRRVLLAGLFEALFQ
jgi:hypothetical protein